MLKTLEEPPAHVKFILATTDPQKIPVTVLSRCLQFNLKQLPPALIHTHLQYVLGQENIPFEMGALNLVSRAAQGSMRDALSLMDQAIAYSSGKVDEALVRTMLGAIDQGYLFDLLQTLRAGDGAGLLRIADQMMTRSVAFEAALQDLATLLHRIALAQTIPNAIAEDEPERARLLELSQQFSPDEIQLNYQIVIHGRKEIDLAPDEYAGFTMTLLRMLAFAPQAAGRAVEPREQVAQATSSPAYAVSRAETVASPSSVPAAMRTVSAQGGTLDWNALLTQLNLQGMARELAKHSILGSFADGRVVLYLAPQHKQLQGNKQAVDKLQSALTEYFAKPIKLSVEIGDTGAVATPAAVEQEVKRTRQQQAEEAIRQDAFVREAQVVLGAQIIESSIKPIQQ
jgi:DNA polymerase-3 subunit gamma/tau